MRSITLKLMIAFLGVSLAGIILVFILASQSTNKEVRNYFYGQSKETLISKFINYYQEQGSWEGVVTSFKKSSEGDFHEQGFNSAKPMFYLFDENNQVVLPEDVPFDSIENIEQKFEKGMPLELDGEKIGTLIFVDTNYNWKLSQPPFLDRINQILIISTIAAIILALGLGALLSHTFSRPIRELTAATKAAAAGDLSHKVVVRSKDELGELAASFNTMNSELDRLITARKQMTADIAHELRTPISIILGNADGVRDGVIPLSSETFDIIAEEAERLESLVEDLHILSRAETGELSMFLTATSIKKMVYALHLPQYQAAQQKHIDISVDIPEGLSEVKADPDRIIQVLRNILNNAYRYTPDNGKISISALQKDEDTVQLRISDNGTGVSENELIKIFNRFYRIDTSRQRDGEGSGLGLAIARSIVERHGGKIWAESNPGGGLSVLIDLPAHKKSL